MKSKFLTTLIATTIAVPALAGDHVHVRPFADEKFVDIPSDVKYPEGLSSDPVTGDIFVATFNVPNAAYNPSPVNSVLRYSASGELLARTDISGPTPLVGIRYNSVDNSLYMASLGDITGQGSKIVKLAADFDQNTPLQVVAEIPFIGTPADRTVWNIDGSTHQVSYGTNIRVPNDIIFDSQGDLYVSDSFQGAVFHLPEVASCSQPCHLETLVHDPLLSTSGFPSFGANGLALDEEEQHLYIANTGDDRILKVGLGQPEGVSVFAEGVNGADGIAFDEMGYLWVTENQADQLTALNDQGRVVARLGSFRGINSNGSPRGLLFPASLEIVGKDILVTNMAQVATANSGDEPEERVSQFTISRVSIPLMMRKEFSDFWSIFE